MRSRIYTAAIVTKRLGESRVRALHSGDMNVNGIDAVYYFAHDFARALEFYIMLIGAPPNVEFGDASACEWTLPNGEAFGLIRGARYRQGNGVLFNVENAAAAVADLRMRGVAFEDNGEIEETPVCFMAFGTDTEGNGFILHQRKAH